ncbi:hypothetical protein LPJ74_006539 [Coemansia sp. RSA 1843]|nr:hypothetical protein LPJ74_006539 [Coemansia sp. RSA 1843]
MECIMTGHISKTLVAGYPSTSQIVDILLALERGGVDMLDFVAPFTDLLADEPASKSDTDAKQSIVSETRTGYVGYVPLIVPLMSKALVRCRVQTAGSLVYFVTHSGITSIRQSLNASILTLLLSKVHKYADLSPTIDIGSHLRSVFCNAERGRKPKRVRHYAGEASAKAKENTPRVAPLPKIDEDTMEKSTLLPDKFGIFCGLYVAEALYECALELEKTYIAFYPYMGRPSPLHFAERLGKSHIIAESGAGQHGVATAAICANLRLECIIYMGSEDTRRQSLTIFRIRALCGKVIPVTKGSCTLKDAINEAMRDLVSNLNTTYHLVSSAIGCHQFPTMARDFQCVIGNETKEQMKALAGRLPDTLVACVGSNAIGMFHSFIKNKNVRLVGAEATGDGVDTSRHSATISAGAPGVFHGAKTYLLQDKKGQVIETHSIAAGLSYPGVGPEHS